MKLGTKIGLLVAFQIMIMLILVIINYLEKRTLQERLSHALQITAPKGVSLNRVRVNVVDSIRLLEQAVLSENEKSAQDAIKRSFDANDLVMEMKKLTAELVAKEGSPEEKNFIDEWNPIITSYFKLHKEISEIAQVDTNLKAAQIMESAILPKVTQLRESLGSLSLQLERELNRAESEKTPNRFIPLHRRIVQVGQISSNLQEMVRILNSHNSVPVDQKQGLEIHRRSILKEIETLFRELEASSDDRGNIDQQLLGKMQNTFADIREQAEKMEAQSRKATNQRATKMILEEATPLNDSLLKILVRYRDYFNKNLESENRQSQDQLGYSFWITLISTLLGIGLSLLLSYLIIRSITKPLSRTADKASLMAGGLADVSRHLMVQSQDLAHQASTVATASEQMANNINTMAAASEEMSMNVASISNASDEMSVNVGTISSAAEETSRNVTNISSSIQAMSQSFQEISKVVGNSSEVASQAMNLASNATSSMKALDHNASEINKVTEMIKMIALQTNLLALNATIEATSAGDAGKGFAVVASEIKELANQSGKAAEDIARKIETMQTSTREAVAVIQNVTSIIDDINQAVEQVSQSVDQQTENAATISRNISEASKGVGDIARSISDVAKGASDMSRNASDAASGATDMSRNSNEAASAGKSISSTIQNLDHAARSNSDSAGQVNSSARELTDIASELKRLI